jgi:DNA-binding GntR family transcriptional regulator
LLKETQTNGIKYKSLVDTIVDDIESRIIRGELKPGERLIEQVMCDQLGVSRSPLREAFRILENRGFIVNNARKGVFVSELSAQDAVDIYTIRANLESLAIYLAVKNDPGTLADELSAINSEMIKYAEAGDTWNYSKNNQSFHETLINASKNKRLIEMLTIFGKQTVRYRAEVMFSKGKMEESIKKHEDIIRSIRLGDPEAAEIMRKKSILKNIDIALKLFS